MAETNVADHVAGDADDEGGARRLTEAPRSDDAASQRAASPVSPVASLKVGDAAEAAPAPDVVAPPGERAEPAVTPLTAASDSPNDLPTHAAPTRPTPRQRILRGLVSVAATLICLLTLAPLILAVLAALGALITDGVAAVTVASLFKRSDFLHMADAMNALSVASRVGFLAIGYLGLFCALMALLSGLLGRGRGRLFIIPGALLTASALVLFAASVALCWPLIAPLAQIQAYRVALIVLSIYVLLDTVTLATVLADTRQTRGLVVNRRRARLPRRSRRVASAEPATRGDAPPTPPPTLASSV